MLILPLAVGLYELWVGPDVMFKRLATVIYFMGFGVVEAGILLLVSLIQFARAYAARTGGVEKSQAEGAEGKYLRLKYLGLSYLLAAVSVAIVSAVMVYGFAFLFEHLDV